MSEEKKTEKTKEAVVTDLGLDGKAPELNLPETVPEKEPEPEETVTEETKEQETKKEEPAVVKNKTVKPTPMLANPSTITWPSDIYGLTSKLKADGLSIASRIGSDPAKLKLVEDTMALLLEHIRARSVQNKDIGPLKPKVSHPVVE